MNLFYSYALEVERAYIIRIKDNEISEQHAKKCADSCDKAGMPYSYWDAYDGVAEKIQPPEHHNAVMDCLKITDHFLTRGEVACALSHISLWARCVLLDKPIVVLEHDALMLQPYLQHNMYNSICYLGGQESFRPEDNSRGKLIPWHASNGPNSHFICRAHAYAIDPAVAKNMLAEVIRRGIYAPADIMIQADLFNIHQVGLFAVDDHKGETTIANRAEGERSYIRNDNLKI